MVVIALSSCGFTLAYYIHVTKKTESKLVCPLEGNCEAVVHSDYSKLFNIHLEVIGMFYYLTVGLLYTFFAFAPGLLPLFMSYGVIGVCLTAFIFSVYLTCVQAFVLKHWCTWCLCSAGISTTIFLLTLYTSNSKVVELFQNLF